MKEFYEFINSQSGDTLFFCGVFVILLVRFTLDGIAGIIKAFKHKSVVSNDKK